MIPAPGLGPAGVFHKADCGGCLARWQDCMGPLAKRQENQKRPGSKSHDLYERYKKSKTLGEAGKGAGLTCGDCLGESLKAG